MVAQRLRRRRVLAALLSFLQPGLGHLYLRAWLRALLWFGLWAATLVAVAAAPVDPSLPEVLATAVGLFAAVGGLSPAVAATVVVVSVFCTVDAYWLAARETRRRVDEGVRCPRCDRELDPALDFCHWCTARVGGEA